MLITPKLCRAVGRGHVIADAHRITAPRQRRADDDRDHFPRGVVGPLELVDEHQHNAQHADGHPRPKGGLAAQ